MSSGERPIGAANGKQLDTEVLCQPPPLPSGPPNPYYLAPVRTGNLGTNGARKYFLSPEDLQHLIPPPTCLHSKCSQRVRECRATCLLLLAGKPLLIQRYICCNTVLFFICCEG